MTDYITDSNGQRPDGWPIVAFDWNLSYRPNVSPPGFDYVDGIWDTGLPADAIHSISNLIIHGKREGKRQVSLVVLGQNIVEVQIGEDPETGEPIYEDQVQQVLQRWCWNDDGGLVDVQSLDVGAPDEPALSASGSGGQDTGMFRLTHLPGVDASVCFWGEEPLVNDAHAGAQTTGRVRALWLDPLPP